MFLRQFKFNYGGTVGAVSFHQHYKVLVQEYGSPRGIEHSANHELFAPIGTVAMIENDDVKTEIVTDLKPVFLVLQKRKINIAKKRRWVSFGAIVHEHFLLRVE